MKKLYIYPVMDVKVFEAENIATVSGRTEGVEASGKTAAELLAEGNAVQSLSYNDMNLWF